MVVKAAKKLVLEEICEIPTIVVGPAIRHKDRVLVKGLLDSGKKKGAFYDLATGRRVPAKVPGAALAKLFEVEGRTVARKDDGTWKDVITGKIVFRNTPVVSGIVTIDGKVLGLMGMQGKIIDMNTGREVCKTGERITSVQGSTHIVGGRFFGGQENIQAGAPYVLGLDERRVYDIRTGELVTTIDVDNSAIVLPHLVRYKGQPAVLRTKTTTKRHDREAEKSKVLEKVWRAAEALEEGFGPNRISERGRRAVLQRGTNYDFLNGEKITEVVSLADGEVLTVIAAGVHAPFYEVNGRVYAIGDDRQRVYDVNSGVKIAQIDGSPHVTMDSCNFFGLTGEIGTHNNRLLGLARGKRSIVDLQKGEVVAKREWRRGDLLNMIKDKQGNIVAFTETYTQGDKPTTIVYQLK